MAVTSAFCREETEDTGVDPDCSAWPGTLHFPRPRAWSPPPPAPHALRARAQLPGVWGRSHLVMRFRIFSDYKMTAHALAVWLSWWAQKV